LVEQKAAKRELLKGWKSAGSMALKKVVMSEQL
jgi:hypothetical protein